MHESCWAWFNAKKNRNVFLFKELPLLRQCKQEFTYIRIYIQMRGSCYGPGSTQKSGSPNKRFLDSYFMLYHFLRPSRQALTSTELSCFSCIIPVGIPVGTIKEFLKNFAPICRSPQMYFRFLYGILQLLSSEFCIGMQKSVNL